MAPAVLPGLQQYQTPALYFVMFQTIWDKKNPSVFAYLQGFEYNQNGNAMEKF